ncbi:GSCOCG00001154001-RA-CDS [Cotesia congregata]|nr:GSCOCG00001154001-RA-CDS [Cotesia congregata]
MLLQSNFQNYPEEDQEEITDLIAEDISPMMGYFSSPSTSSDSESSENINNNNNENNNLEENQSESEIIEMIKNFGEEIKGLLEKRQELVKLLEEKINNDPKINTCNK